MKDITLFTAFILLFTLTIIFVLAVIYSRMKIKDEDKSLMAQITEKIKKDLKEQ